MRSLNASGVSAGRQAQACNQGSAHFVCRHAHGVACCCSGVQDSCSSSAVVTVFCLLISPDGRQSMQWASAAWLDGSKHAARSCTLLTMSWSHAVRTLVIVPAGGLGPEVPAAAPRSAAGGRSSLLSFKDRATCAPQKEHVPPESACASPHQR